MYVAEDVLEFTVTAPIAQGKSNQKSCDDEKEMELMRGVLRPFRNSELLIFITSQRSEFCNEGRREMDIQPCIILMQLRELFCQKIGLIKSQAALTPLSRIDSTRWSKMEMIR